jgi:RNA polymerase sigma-70 factor, ECF subfamily
MKLKMDNPMDTYMNQSIETTVKTVSTIRETNDCIGHGLSDSARACELEALRPYLMRYAYAKLNNFHLAEDLVQDTMLAILADKSTFDGRSTLRTWVTSILKFKIFDAYQHNVTYRNRHLSFNASEDVAALQEDILNSLVDTEIRRGLIDPAIAIEHSQLTDCISIAVNKLPIRQRDAFVLVHIHELSGSEAAKRIGISLSNLWVILHRSRIAMIAQLKRTYLQ